MGTDPMPGVEQKRPLKGQRAAISKASKGRTRQGVRVETPQPTPPANWYECVKGERTIWENRRVRSELVCFGEVMFEAGGRSCPAAPRQGPSGLCHAGSPRSLAVG